MVKTSVVNLNNPNILTVNNDTTIGEDSTDYLTVNSETRFLSDVNIGGSSIKLHSSGDDESSNFIEIKGQKIHSTDATILGTIKDTVTNSENEGKILKIGNSNNIIAGDGGGGGGSGIVNNRIDGDLTIGEDSTDLMVVNSKTEFSNDVDVGTDLVVSKTISAKNVNEDIRNKAYTLNNKIDTHNDSWSQLGQDLVGDDGDQSGRSVSLSADGTILAIGAPAHDADNAGDPSPYEGRTRIYQYSSNTSTWSQLGEDLVGGDGDQSGISVSLSSDGTIVAIGANHHDVGTNTNEGRTRIWKYRTVSQSEWESSNIFIATAGQTGVGNDTTGDNRGEAYSPTTKYWIQLGSDIDGDDSDFSGNSVSLSADGTIVAIGGGFLIGGVVPRVGGPQNQGRTRIYQYSSNTWSQLGQDLVGDPGDYSGRSVSLSADGTIVAIGAKDHDVSGNNDEGRTRIYQYSSNTWYQLGQDLVGDYGDNSGNSVSLSADGTIVAIGAHLHDASGDNHGRTRIYQYSSNGWSQLGQDLIGDDGDYSGDSVSLSADGTIVAIGARYHDVDHTLDDSTDEGRTRIYHLSDYFKSNVKIDGNLNIKNLPTSSSGLSSGDIYVDNGFLKIFP